MTKAQAYAAPGSEPEESPSPPRWPTWLILALILALATGLRLYRLGAENLWIDEVFSLEQVTDPITGIRGYWGIDEQATSRPLGLSMLYLALHFGDSEFVTRLPFAILSVLDVAAVYFLLRELVERRVALRAALFLAVLPIHVWYAQEVRWYAQWALLATVSTITLVRLWKSGRLAWWLGYVVAAVAALYTFLVSLHLLAMQAVSAWLLPDRGRRWTFRWKVGAALGLAAIAALPVFMAVLGLRPGDSGGMVGTPRDASLVVLPYLFFTYVAGYTIGPSVADLHALPGPSQILKEHPEIVVYYVAFGLIALLGLWSLRRRRVAAAVLVPWVVGMPLLVIMSAILVGQTFNVRYTFAAVPGFVAVLSLGVEALGRWRVVGTAGVVALFGLSLVNFYSDPYYDKEDIRGAVGHVRSSVFPESPVAVVGQGTVAVAHYGEGLEFGQLVGCEPREVLDEAPVPRLRVEELQDEPSLWMLVSRDWENRVEPCSEELSESHRVVERQTLPGVDLYLLERR